jgi:alpha-L-rhamnosidase
MSLRKPLFSILLIVISFRIAYSGDVCIPGNLRCEYLVNPLGIDTHTPRLSWLLNDDRHGALQTSYRILIGTDSLSVANGSGNVWDSRKVDSDKMLVTYSGKSLEPFTKYYWSVEVWDKDRIKSAPSTATFETGMLEPGNWRGSWISDEYGIEKKEAPLFRKDFIVNRKVRSARAYIAVGGLYELYFNGKKTGDHRLDPMYTRFDRRILYVTYDITDNLTQGANTVGVLLGNGWYNHQSTAVWYFDKAPWRNRPVFCMDIRISYEDGTTEILSTDNTWKSSLGPVVFNSIYTGEHYDARLEQPGWNKPGFNDQAWRPAVYRSAPSLNIVSQQLHPVRNVEAVQVKSVSRINDSIFVFDLGRNIAGVSCLKVRTERGTLFRLKHAEKLGSDGRVDMSNINVHYRPTDDSDPFQTDIFIAGGSGEETFMPRFNYKGFRYVEITSSRPVTLTADNLTGFFMHSDVPPAGYINSSNPVIDKIWTAANNSYLSNLFGYPTDCPQREKNGWTGDAHIASETGLFNFDGITVYEKWLADHRDEQQPNGVLPAIIPTSGWGYHWANGPDWTSTIAIIPWNIYLFYGDIRLLSDCYENIRRYVDHITDISPSGLTTWGLGDWVPVKSKTPVELTSSVYYYVDASILSGAAGILGREEDQIKYSALAEKIRNAINAKYLDAEKGVYGAGVQTELSVPLQWDVVPAGLRSKVAENLALKVKADNSHIDVGLLGSKAILNALSENGYADLAYTLASQETFPSWGWWIVNGATTLYENWPVDAKSDISMNHIMFGEIGAWFYKALGGINPDPQNPGFKNILFRPVFPERLMHFRSEHDSPSGKIISEWKRNRKNVIWDITVPANSTADITCPSGYELISVKLASGNEIYRQKQKRESTMHLDAGRFSIELSGKALNR